MTRFTAPFVLAVLLLGVACGGAGDEPPVATPSLIITPSSVPLGAPVEMSFRFVVAPDARFDGDYRVMLHFVDPYDEMLWAEDHDPPTPTSSWRPGQTIEYARTVFLPVYPYLGEASVQVGLYHPERHDRLPLAGKDNGQRAYAVATLELRPQSEGVFVVYGDGWHSPEVSGADPLDEWRWTSKRALVSFRNPQRDALLYLDVDGRPDLFDSPQQVTLSLGDVVVDTFALSARDRVLRKTTLSSTDMGTSDIVELAVEVDSTFVPAQQQGSDYRQLGVRVFHLYVEPR